MNYEVFYSGWREQELYSQARAGERRVAVPLTFRILASSHSSSSHTFTEQLKSGGETSADFCLTLCSFPVLLSLSAALSVLIPCLFLPPWSSSLDLPALCVSSPFSHQILETHRQLRTTAEFTSAVLNSLSLSFDSHCPLLFNIHCLEQCYVIYRGPFFFLDVSVRKLDLVSFPSFWWKAEVTPSPTSWNILMHILLITLLKRLWCRSWIFSYESAV